MKQHFLELVQLLRNSGLIEPHYKIISYGKLYSTDQLTITNISEGFILYEKLNLFQPEEDQDIEF